MILVESSAWIHFFRGTEPYYSAVDQVIADGTAAICGPVVTELRRGLRASERTEVLTLLEGCTLLEQPDALWERAGDLGLLLRQRGVTAKTLDLLIAIYTLDHKTWLLAADADYVNMQRAHVPLTLVTP